MQHELVRFKKEVDCAKCGMRLAERGTILPVLDGDDQPIVAQSSGGYSMDELQERYRMACDCGETTLFRTTDDAVPIFGEPSGPPTIKVHRVR